MPESYFSVAGKNALTEAMDEMVRENLDEGAHARYMGMMIDREYDRRHDA